MSCLVDTYVFVDRPCFLRTVLSGIQYPVEDALQVVSVWVSIFYLTTNGLRSPPLLVITDDYP